MQPRFAALALALRSTAAHEYLGVPPSRTGDCLLNAVVMGSKLCKTSDGADQQCKDDPLNYVHLFNLHPAYDSNACGGSSKVSGWNLGSCGSDSTEPEKFDMTLQGPEETTQWTAGSEVELHMKGFFHEGVSRVALCFRDDSDCNAPGDFMKYVLGYHFTEGTAGSGDIYSVDMPFKVTLPYRNGKAVVQWLVDAEDVRSYVSCSDIEVSGAEMTGLASSEYVCNGHPLCNCTTGGNPVIGSVGLGLECPRGTAPSVVDGGSTGTDIVKQYKEQLGVKEFCGLCMTNGCPSTCGGKYDGFYEGPKCSNTPVLDGCGDSHATSLPRYVSCTSETCTSGGWTPTLV